SSRCRAGRLAGAGPRRYAAAVRGALLLCLVVGCGKQAEQVAPDTQTETQAADAAGAAESSSSSTVPRAQPPPVPFPRVHLTLTLRSTPPGAAAAVDGRPIGQTPGLYGLASDAPPPP